MAKEKLSFYDVKSKAKFETYDYEVIKRDKRFYAIAKSKSGTHDCWRVISKQDFERIKER